MNGFAANSSIPPIYISFIIAVFAFAGLFMLFRLLQNVWMFKKSSHWSTTQGKILFSGVESQTSMDEDGTNTTFLAKVIYRYQVSDRTYENNQIAFNCDLSTANYSRQADLAAQYPQGSSITVYYDPDDPENAVLERKLFSVLVSLLMAAVFLGISLSILLVVILSNPTPLN